MLSSSFLFSSPSRLSLTALPISPREFTFKGGFSYTGFLRSSFSITSSTGGASRRFVAFTSPELCRKNIRYPRRVAPKRKKYSLSRLLLPQGAIVLLPSSVHSRVEGSCPVGEHSRGDAFTHNNLITLPCNDFKFVPHILFYGINVSLREFSENCPSMCSQKRKNVYLDRRLSVVCFSSAPWIVLTVINAMGQINYLLSLASYTTCSSQLGIKSKSMRLFCLLFQQKMANVESFSR